MMVMVAIFPKRDSACRVERHNPIRLDRNAYVKFMIRIITYSGLFQKCCEISWDKRIATARPVIDSVITVFVIVFWVAAASSFWFFPSFSEVNLTRAVGKAMSVNREKVEARKLRIDRVPMSVWVRAFVFVTIM